MYFFVYRRSYFFAAFTPCGCVFCRLLFSFSRWLISFRQDMLFHRRDFLISSVKSFSPHKHLFIFLSLQEVYFFWYRLYRYYSYKRINVLSGWFRETAANLCCNNCNFIYVFNFYLQMQLKVCMFYILFPISLWNFYLRML